MKKAYAVLAGIVAAVVVALVVVKLTQTPTAPAPGGGAAEPAAVVEGDAPSAPAAQLAEAPAPQAAPQPAAPAPAEPEAAAPAEGPRLVVRGRVVLADGQPGGGTEITMSRMMMTGGRLQMEEEVAATARADERGYYRIEGPDHYIHTIKAAREGFGSRVVSLYNDEWYRNAQSGVQGGTREVEQGFTLQPAVRIAGRVIDENGQVVAGAEVSATSAQLVTRYNTETIDHFNRIETTSDEDGRFSLDELNPEEVILVAKASGYLMAEDRITAPADDVELRLSSRGASIEGVVYRFETGEPVTSATVRLSLRPDDKFQTRPLDALAPREMVTDASGQFHFEPLAEGEYHLHAEKEGLGLLPRKDSGPINLAAMERVAGREVYLYSGHAIRGRVTDKESGEPIEGVQVTAGQPVMNPDGTIKTPGPKDTTDAQGNYRLTGVMAPRALVGASIRGYTLDSPGNLPGIWVTLGEGQLEVAQDIQMSLNVTVSGMVLYPDGSRVRAGQVSYIRENLTPDRNLINIEPDGTFEIEVKPMTSGAVMARVAGYPDAYSELIQIKIEPVTGVEVRLERAGSLAGVVKDSKGQPVAGAKVNSSYLVPLTNQMWRGVNSGDATTGGDGSFFIADVAPKDIRLKAEAEGHAPSRELTINLKPGENRTGIEIRLQEAHFFAGRVVDPQGNPVARAQIFLNANRGGFHRNMQTGDDGRFRFEQVPETTLNLSVSKESHSQQYYSHQLPLDREDVELVFGDETGATLIGRVVDVNTKQPIRDFAVTSVSGLRNIQKDDRAPGVFRAEGLKPNYYYRLRIEAPGYAALESEDVSVQPGEEIIERTFEMGSGATLRGRLVDDKTRQPVAGALVELQKVTRLLGERNEPLAVKKSGEDGRFEFTAVMPPEARLRITPAKPHAEKLVTTDVAHGAARDLGDIELDAGSTLTVHAIDSGSGRPAPDVTVQLIRGPTFVGQQVGEEKTDAGGTAVFTGVTTEPHFLTLPDQLMYVSGNPPAGDVEVQVAVGNATLKGTILKAGKPFQGRINYSTARDGVRYNNKYSEGSSISSAEGRFDAPNLFAGTWTFSISETDDYRTVRRFELRIEDSRVLEHTFVIPAGELVGRVIREDSDWVRGARVSIEAADGQALSGTSEVESGTNGHFAFKNLEAGQYHVTAYHPDYGKATVENIAVPEEGAAPETTVQLRRGGGTLVSAAYRYENGEPLREAWCDLTGPDGKRFNHAAQRGADGVMRVEFIPPGIYDVEVSYWSYSIGTHRVEIAEGQQASIEDVLYRAGALRWRIVDAAGNPVADVACTLAPLDPASIERPRSGRTDSNGEFVARGLWPGDYRAQATLAGGRVVSEVVTIREADMTQQQTTVE